VYPSAAGARQQPAPDTFVPTWSPTGHALAFATATWPTSTLQVVAQPGGTARTITPEGAYGAANRRGLQWTDPGLFGYVGGKPTLLRLA
jgi:hypothetical protein